MLRYIEVYKASRSEMAEQGRKIKLYQEKRSFSQSNLPQPPFSYVGVGPDGVYCHLIQMRGLPFKATEKDIRSFFDQFQICGKNKIDQNIGGPRFKHDSQRYNLNLVWIAGQQVEQLLPFHLTKQPKKQCNTISVLSVSF